MSTLTEPRADRQARPPREQAPPPREPRTGRSTTGEVVRLVAVLALMLSSVAPLSRVYTDGLWLRPVAASLLVAVGICWGVHQLGGRGPAILGASLLGWAGFSTAVLAPTTAWLGVVPTRATLEAGGILLSRAAELIRLESAPVAAEAPLLLVTVSATWALATIVCDAAFHRRLPLVGVTVALVGLSIPVPLTSRTSGLVFAVPFLVAAAAVLLAFGAVDARRWGQGADVLAEPLRRRVGIATGAALAVLAVAAGGLLSDALPGFGEPPLYEVRGRGSAPSTNNPIVDLRARLTATETATVMEVTAERPVYLRTTALDTYEDQRWTTESIRGTPIDSDGRVAPEVEAARAEEVEVEVDIAELRGELVPVPYPPVEADGPLASEFQHDPRNGTVILDGGGQISRGDSYRVTAALPEPDPARLGAAEGFAPDGQLTALPDAVPDRVSELATEIVAEAGASTPLEQALAIQDELQGWEYSLAPPQGHGEDALNGFLDSRIGYCEQFAATMALMLRTLDIPARVAVGYTPGTLVDPEEDRWEITNDNAHAWVEVLFPEVGWLSFEPTPRSDGNVLVPSAANLVPDDTVAGDLDSPEVADAGDEDALVPPDEPAEPTDRSLGGDESASSGAPEGEAGSPWPWILMAAVTIVVVPALVVLQRRGDEASARDPLDRIRHARRRAEHAGYALGVVPRPSETDAEFLSRIAERSGNGTAVGAARVLAGESARARYAPQLPQGSAERAEAALASLLEAMPAPASPVDRLRRAARVASTTMRRRVQASSHARRVMRHDDAV